MPLSQTVITQALVGSVVAEIIEEALLHPCRLGVGVNVPQGVQCPFVIRLLETTAMVSLLPEMPRPVQHPIKAHGGVPVETVHDARQVLWDCGFEHIVDMIRHDAEGIELEFKLLYSSFEGI